MTILRVLLVSLLGLAGLFVLAHFAEPLLLPGLANARAWYHGVPSQAARALPELPERSTAAEGAPERILLLLGAARLREADPARFDRELAERLVRRDAGPYRYIAAGPLPPLRELARFFEELAAQGPRPELRVVLFAQLEGLAPWAALREVPKPPARPAGQGAPAAGREPPDGQSAPTAGQKPPDGQSAPTAGQKPPAGEVAPAEEPAPPLPHVPRGDDWLRWPVLSLQEAAPLLLVDSAHDQLPVVLWPLLRRSAQPDLERARWDRYAAELAAFVRAVRAAQATLLVAWLPHPIEWQSSALSDLLERHDAAPGSFESARARRRILDLCAESELPCLDLAASLLLAGRDRAALISYDPARPWDWAPTERGIDVLLESLSQRLAPLLPRD